MIDLQSLSALMNDEALVRKYLHRFSDDMPMLMKLMWDAFTTQDWKEIGLHTHTFKTQMQYINDPESTNLALKLEQSCAGASPDREAINQLLIHLDQQLLNTLKEIRSIIA